MVLHFPTVFNTWTRFYIKDDGAAPSELHPVIPKVAKFPTVI